MFCNCQLTPSYNCSSRVLRKLIFSKHTSEKNYRARKYLFMMISSCYVKLLFRLQVRAKYLANTNLYLQRNEIFSIFANLLITVMFQRLCLVLKNTFFWLFPKRQDRVKFSIVHKHTNHIASQSLFLKTEI